jgi:hypothetical protein
MDSAGRAHRSHPGRTLIEAIQEKHLGLFVATISVLIEGDYLQLPGAD